MNQVDVLTLPVIVSRLVNARRHLLALRVASAAGTSPDQVRTCHSPFVVCNTVRWLWVIVNLCQVPAVTLQCSHDMEKCRTQRNSWTCALTPNTLTWGPSMPLLVY